MLRISIYIGILLVLFSCNKGSQNNTPIARVYDVYLYQEDLKEILQNQIEQDSALIVSSYINQWAKEQLLFHKAKINLDEKEKENIDALVNHYHKDLLVSKYKEAIINQELDTVITQNNITSFYIKNKEIFKLNEELIKIKYIHFSEQIKNSSEFVKLFRMNSKEANTKILKQELQLKLCDLNDSTWVRYTDVIKKVPFFKSLKKSSFLNKNYYFKENDSTGVYLIIVKDVLLRNQTSPLSYATPIIKQMILHKRKLELFKKIEETLTEDAIKNKNFQIY